MDKPPGLVAQADQVASELSEYARILGAYYRGLVKEGIPEENASELVNAYAGLYWETTLHRCCSCQVPFTSDPDG